MKKKIDIDFTKIKENGVIRKEVMRVYRTGKQNTLHVIGLPGTGKSWYCLRLAEQLSEDIHGVDEETGELNYNITFNNVVDNLLSLLKFIRKVKSPGEIVVAEELGVWLSSKRAMSSENVDAGYVWDTLRKKRVVVIGNNPISKDIDKKLMALSTMQIQTLTLNKRKGICIVKPLRLQTNPDTAKTYRHRLTENGRDVHRCWSGKPKKELTDDYEKGKDDFLEELYRRLEKKHQDKLDKELGKIGEKVGVVTKIESERARLRERGLSTQEIADLQGKCHEAIRKSLVSYDRKIYKISKTKKTDGGNTGAQQINH